jgi:hypothetical protein
MPSHSEPGWSNPRVLTIFSLIFLCGLAFGCALTRGYLHSHMPHGDRHDVAIESARRVGLQNLKGELKLSPEQEHFITQELDDYSKYYQNIEDERRDVAEHGKQRILNVLDDAQKRKFNDLFSPEMRADGQP